MIAPAYTSSADAQRNPFYVIYVVLIHFLLSIHHGWIDPILSSYRTMYAAEAAAYFEDITRSALEEVYGVNQQL